MTFNTHNSPLAAKLKLFNTLTESYTKQFQLPGKGYTREEFQPVLNQNSSIVQRKRHFLILRSSSKKQGFI